MKKEIGPKFDSIFKTTPTDNESGFADLPLCFKDINTLFYDTHPYSAFERAIDESDYGLIRRIILKGKAISNASNKKIEYV